MICEQRHRGSINDQWAVSLQVFSDPLKEAVLQDVLRNHLWIVEEELRLCIGLPPWFDSALCFILAEIVRDLASYRPRKASTPQWIKEKAKQVGRRLERTLAKRHSKNGLVAFEGHETFASLLGLLLQRPRSLYWDELRGPKSPGPRCRTLGDGI